MPRVGTCQGCGARYKVPDSVTATRAKCKKCGDVVSIPPAGADEESAPPSKRSAPAAGSPSSRRTRSRAGGAASAQAATTDTAPAAPRRGGGRRAAKRGAGRAASGGGRRKRAGADGASPRKGLPLVPIFAIVLVLAAAGVGGWALGWFGGGAESAPGDLASTAAGSAKGADPASVDGTTSTPGAPVGDSATQVPDPPPATHDDTDDAASLADGTLKTSKDTGARPAKKAPARPLAKPPEPEQPLGPLLEFELLPPLPGTDPDDFAEWSAALTTVYVDGTSPRKERELRAMLEESDVVDQTPAYINTILGRDMSDPIQVRDTYRLVDHWQKRVANFPRFFFDGDTTKMDVEDVNKRVKVILDPKQGWIAWWRGKQDDAGALSKYREDLAAKLAQEADEDI